MLNVATRTLHVRITGMPLVHIHGSRTAPGQTSRMTDEPGGRPQPLPPVRPALATWHRFTGAAPSGADLSTDVAVYGADIPTESTLRLLGTLEGKRVLDLGCGAGHAAVAFARQGAKVIAVDPSSDQLDQARQAAEAAEVRIELQQAQLAELAFVRADAIDVAFSAFALAEVADIDRVFRQVHRVLKPECPIVFSLPHPAFTMFAPTADPALVVQRRYHDPAPVVWYHGDDEVVDHSRTVSSVFTSLTRANFRVDAIVEPEVPDEALRSQSWADLMRCVPATIIYRARKLGI
jgi:2-polyprenyl-3-methyl-5-hydroxy-6-metoxy-1,4-benzoquinol methylase